MKCFSFDGIPITSSSILKSGYSQKVKKGEVCSKLFHSDSTERHTDCLRGTVIYRFNLHLKNLMNMTMKTMAIFIPDFNQSSPSDIFVAMFVKLAS